MRTFLLTLVSLMSLVPATSAQVVVPLPFGDHMVLQRDRKVPVWGTAAPGERVTVAFAGQTVEAVANDKGKWRADLAPMPASSEPRELVVRGTNTVTIKDVLVGEVWIASGQSNMDAGLNTAQNAVEEIRAADYPHIRYFLQEKNFSADAIDEVEGVWRVVHPTNARDMSAAAYFFARNLHKSIDVPIGIIDNGWGGLRAEPFVCLACLKSTPSFHDTAMAYEKYWHDKRKARADALAAGVNPREAPKIPASDNSDPTAVYNAVIHPIAPYRVRGVIWYQGESNAHEPERYQELLTALIGCWRHTFEDPDLPFGIVQLANFQTRVSTPIEIKSWADLRDAQLRTARSVAQVDIVTAIDVGDEKNIHPANKQAVGARLAVWARACVYGQGVNWLGPMYKSMAVRGNEVTLSFDYARGLAVRGDRLAGFAIAGEDKVFYHADATLVGDQVVVKSDRVSAPVAVRYAWMNNPPSTLYNDSGLPAFPFRTDDWKSTDVKVGK